MKSVGGSVLNSLCVAASHLPPDSVAYFGVVGCDADGALIRTHLEGHGVRFVEAPVTPQKDANGAAANQHTGSCMVLVNDAKRSMVTDLAVGRCVSAAQLQSPAVSHAIRHARCVYATGFLLPDAAEAVRLLVGACTDKLFAFNLAAPAIVRSNFAASVEMLGAADVVVGDLREFAAIAGICDACSEVEVAAAMRAVHLRMRFAPLAVLRDFRRAAAAASADLDFDAETDASDIVTPILLVTNGPHNTHVVCGRPPNVVHRIFSPPSVSLHRCVNTSGAGDAFVGGFLSALATGCSLEACVSQAHACAHDYITQSSARFRKLVDGAGVFDDADQEAEADCVDC